jgi:membrane-bound metal-dependent hydrolase YbcI (DUF457 family)
LIHLRHRHSPRDGPTLLLILGTQLPDLVDKPLNWWFGILDGRGIGHSLFVIVPISVLVVVVADRYDRTAYGAAFSIGLVTHLAGDVLPAAIGGDIWKAGYLLWPLLPAPTYQSDSFWDHLDRWVATVSSFEPGSAVSFVQSAFALQLLLTLLLLVVWAGDGFPGLQWSYRWLRGRIVTTDR